MLQSKIKQFKKNPKLIFKDVCFAWPGKLENVINKCSFSIIRPGIWMIVGNNGCGKSTLLKLINGILKPNSGYIERSADISMVFQNPDHQILMPNCRSELLINLNTPLSNKDIYTKVNHSLEKVGLLGYEKRPVHTLSGGQKQRLAIACALISNRNFILMDEPTALLDQFSQISILRTIQSLTKNKSKPFTALWITHRLEELDYADKVAVMRNGTISKWQKPSDFKI